MPTPAELNQIRDNFHENITPRRSSYKLLFFVVGIVALLIIVASILSILTPKTIQVRETAFVTTNIDDTRLNLENVRFTGQDISVPEQLFLAQPITQVLKPAEIVDSMITRLDLVRVQPGIDQWKNDNYTLSKDKYLERYILVLTEHNPEQKLPIVKKAEALQVAEKFVADLVPNSSFSSLPDSIQFMIIEQDTALANEQEATAVQVTFAPKINDIPVFYKKESRPAFTVIVDGNNRIRRTIFLPQFDSYQTTQEVPSISIDDAILNIKQGKASIINAQYLSEELSLANLKEAELTTVSLEYREDPTQNIVYPFYRFGGKATTPAGLGVELEIITPAINTLSVRR